jgi:hypothetical protein
MIAGSLILALMLLRRFVRVRAHARTHAAAYICLPGSWLACCTQAVT